MELFTKQITTGDLFSVYGTVGYMDYTIRRRLRMSAPVDGEVLRRAVQATAKRYPYFSVRLRFGGQGFFYEKNDAPIAVLHTAGRIRLAAEESNHHIWAVCYDGDEIFIDFFHGLADGIGVSALTVTLLYYYCAERYGEDIDPRGIRRLEDPIDPTEYADPMDALPEIELPEQGSAAPPVFDLIRDAGMTPCETIAYDIIVPEAPFLRFTSASDASPGTMVSLLCAKAIDECSPGRDKLILGHYAMNARPAIQAPNGHHNCLATIDLPYSERVKALPFQTQCTAYRGMTFLQSDADRVRPILTATASMLRKTAQNPDLDARREVFHRFLEAACTGYSYVVSYTGQWRHPALAKYIREFWTHAPGALPFVIEIKSISGNLFLSVLQSFREDRYLNAFLSQLEQNGIPYTLSKTAKNDIAAFPMPD